MLAAAALPLACLPRAALLKARPRRHSVHAAPLRPLLPLPPLRRPKQPLGWQGRHATAAPAPRAEAVPAGAPLFGQPAAASAAPEERQLGSGLRSLLSPLSDARANAKLLALCTAQMLGSVATLIHDTFLPLYLSEVLHLSNTQIGNLQGLSQFLAKASGSVGGTLADILSPARMVIFGTLLTAVSKPMFALSGAVYTALGITACLSWITFAKVCDRTSKGLREAPAKALIGELAAESGDSPAAAFSLRQALMMTGALFGSAGAALVFKLTGQSYTVTFALATLPATLAVLLLVSAFGGSRECVGGVAGKGDCDCTASEDGPTLGLLGKARALLGAFPAAYWQALAVVSILYLARFDVTFGTLRAKMFMERSRLPLLLPIMILPQAALATPMGMLAKRSAAARNAVLLLGIAVQVVTNLAFAFMPNAQGMMLGALCIGIHMAMTHGVSLGMLSSYIPAGSVPGLGRVSGTAWSFTDMVLAFVLAYSNSLAGRLCDLTVRQGSGNIGCFLGGACACACSIVALLFFSLFGDLGRNDLLPGAKDRRAPAAA